MSTIHDNSKSKKINKSCNEKHRQHLARARDAGNWFAFFRPYYRIMSRLEAVFIQDLHNLMGAARHWSVDDEGRDFFKCTANFLSDSESMWSEDEQGRHLASLKSRGFVDYKRMGMPAVRWVHIDILAIEEALDKAINPDDSQSGGFPPDKRGGFPPDKRGGFPPENKDKSFTSVNEKKEKPRSRFSSPQVTGFSFVNGTNKSKPNPVIDQKYKPDLKRLKEIIRTAQPAVAVAPTRLAENLDALRLLIEKDLNGNYEAFTTVLEDYADYINAIEKGPTIDSAVKFRKHFNWIRDLVNREKKDVVIGNTYTGE